MNNQEEESGTKVRRFLSRFYTGLQRRIDKAVGYQKYRIPTVWMTIDQQLYTNTKVDLSSRCKATNIDWLFEVNMAHLCSTYHEIAMLEIQRLRPRRYWVSPGINRDAMEKELNFIYDDLDFRVMQTVGENDYKALTVWRIIYGRFRAKSGFAIEKDIARRKRDMMIELYACGKLDAYLETADSVLEKYGV